MTQMRFEIRQDVDKIVTDLSHALTDNMSPHYALGYLCVTLTDVLMDLPPEKRKTHVHWLKQALLRELELAQDKKDAA
jgi:hypothetical protein